MPSGRLRAVFHSLRAVQAASADAVFVREGKSTEGMAQWEDTSMTRRARRTNPNSAKPASGETSDGAERYMWSFPDGDAVVLSIPGLRDLKLSPDEARAAGKMLIETADQISGRQVDQAEQAESGTEDQERGGR
jgi:hypothetical protein